MSDFERPSLSALIDRAQTTINGRVTGAESRLRRSFLETLAKVHAGGLNGLYGYAEYIAKQTLPDEATDWLPRHAAIWGIAPKAATLATGLITVTGADGAEIPAGTELQRADGTLYETTTDATIDGASEDVVVTAVEAGAGGNADAGTGLTFISPVAGVNSAAEVAAGGLSGGNDAEKEEQLRGRILQRIRNRPQGGSAADYETWTLEVPGVTRVWVYPRWMGPGTVGVTFVMDGRDNIFPLTADLNAVIAHLTPLRPVTADLYVFAPTPMPIDLAIRLTPDTAKVRTAAEAELRDMVERDAEPGGTIFLSRINEALSITPGEEDHVVHTPSDDIEAAPGYLPVFNSVEWLERLMDAESYRDQLVDLLPSGAAWDVTPGEPLDQLLLAFGDGFAAFDARLLELLEEADPRTTTELVTAWEVVAGLPDECVPESAFIEDRRAAIWQKLTGVGGQSIAYYTAVAERLNSEISIQEFPTFHAGSPCGMPVYGADWKHVWQVTVISSPDEPGVLECVLRRLAPAHTVVIFAYAEGVYPSFFFDFTVGV